MPEAPPDDSREVLLLVDGNNLVYRSFFALPPLANRAGVPTNAVLGFANVMRKLLAEEKPALGAVVFDAGGKTVRHERFEQYKANRPETPPDLKQQMPYARKLAGVLGLPIVEERGVEADDIIGSLARRALDEGYEVLVVSSDKDLLQLVRDHLTVIHPVKYDRLDRAAVEDKLGVPPERVVDLLALKGDSVDNIPGVPGIGDKGAAKLIAAYGPLEAILEHAEEVKNKRQREALLEHRDGALLSKELVTIDCELEVPVELASLRMRGADRDAAFALFEELEFTSHLKDYLPVAEPEDVTLEATAVDGDGLAELLSRARELGKLALWLELSPSKRFDPWSQTLNGVGLSVEKGRAVYARFEEEELLEALGDVLADASVSKLGHDLKPAIAFLRARGRELRGSAFDTKVAAYVLNPSRRSQELSDLVLEFLQTPLGKERGEGEEQGTLPGMAGGENASAKGELDAERAERVLRLSEKMAKRLEEEELTLVHETLELPLVPVLAQMELQGIAIDTELFREMSDEIGREIDALTQEIYELAGVEFNINSPRQLGEVLFEKMNLPSFKKTEKQRAASTRVEVLEELAKSFPFPRKVLDYRGLTKLKGTYVDALPGLVNSRTGRIHTTFNQTVAATGRLSSSDPNLQNIPIRTELGRRLRRAFVAAPGRVLLSADYSQIELRVLAHLSGDENLIEAFEAGEDIHERTARQVFGEDELDPHERRRRAKIINFSIIYGKTAFTLGKDFGIPTREAQAFIDAYFERYPKVRELLDEIIRDARRTGKVRTLFGRQRYVPEIGSRNRNTRAGAERVAVNTPIQGTAADLIKKAMLDLARELDERSLSSRLLLQVHDELVLEVPEEEIEAATSLVKDTMEHVHPLAVPLQVDVKVGRSWEH